MKDLLISHKVLLLVLSIVALLVFVVWGARSSHRDGGSVWAGIFCTAFLGTFAILACGLGVSALRPSGGTAGGSNTATAENVAHTVANTAIVLSASAHAVNPNAYLRMAAADLTTTESPVVLHLEFASGGELYYSVTSGSYLSGTNATVCLVEHTSTREYRVRRSPCSTSG
jgi:hypothetical protein